MNDAKGKGRVWLWAIPVVAMAIVVAALASTMAQASLDDSSAAKSEEYVANMELQDLAVVLQENGADCPRSITDDGSTKMYTGLLQDLNGGNPITSFGKYYDENLAAHNVGSYDEYVRVVINKYWLMQREGEWIKDTELNPALIMLKYNEDDWIVVDDPAITGNAEQVILYSKRPISVDGSSSFVTGLGIDPQILEAKEEKYVGDNYFTYEYGYADNKIGLDVEVSAVQTGSTRDAILSAWGVNIDDVHGTGEKIVPVD